MLRSFPDFKLLPFQGRMTEMLTAVLITHFHLDHCAALPYLTEVITQITKGFSSYAYCRPRIAL